MPAMKSPALLVVLLLLLGCAQGQEAGGVTGRLYVGLFKYFNDGNRLSSGRCCQGDAGPNDTCPGPCNLIIHVAIYGLDGINPTDPPLILRPSNASVSNGSILEFGFNSNISPMPFTFHSWPDCVTIAVDVFHVNLKGNGSDEVDNMTLNFALARADPSALFTSRNLTGSNHSWLEVLLRLECITNCPTASLQNVKSFNVMDCPPSTTTSTTTQTTTTTPTTTTTTPTTTTTTPTTTTSTSTTPTTTSTTTSTSTSTTAATTAPTTPPTATSPTSTSSAATTATTTLMTTTTMTVATTKPSTFGVPSAASGGVLTSTTTSTTAVSSQDATIKDRGEPTKRDDVMDYWAVILGAVLGGLVFLGVVGFCLYSQRRKALIHKQEIYTVTPRILSVVEEDGTAGPGEIPVETAAV